MPWGHEVNCRLCGGQQRADQWPSFCRTNPGSRKADRPQKGRPCPGPGRPLAHGRGGGAASPRAGAFRPPLAARGSLSLPLLGFCCRAPSLCGPRVNPISRGEAPVTLGLPHPRGLSPTTPRLRGGPNGPARVTARGPSPFRAPTPAPGRHERASVSRPEPPPARNGVGERGAPPGAARRGQGARGGRGARRSGRRSRPPRCAVSRGWRGAERAGADRAAATVGRGAPLRRGVGAAAARPSPPAAAPARVRGRLCAGRGVGEGGDEEGKNRDVQRLSCRLGVGVGCGWGAIG